MMVNQGSLRMENPYTISWEPPHSVNTQLSTPDVLQRSTQLLHLTNPVFSVVEFAQVERIQPITFYVAN